MTPGANMYLRVAVRVQAGEVQNFLGTKEQSSNEP